jgi:hypothetical protein
MMRISWEMTQVPQKNSETSIDASKEVGLEEEAERSKHTLLSRHHTAGQNHDIKIANTSVENVPLFKYLGTTDTSNDFDPGGNYEETEFWRCLLPFSPEPFVYSSAERTRKRQNIQN